MVSILYLISIVFHILPFRWIVILVTVVYDIWDYTTEKRMSDWIKDADWKLRHRK